MSLKVISRLFFLTLFILFFDFVSKGLVHLYLQPAEHASRFFPYGGLAVFQNFKGIDFCIHHVTNRGAAWGIGGSFQDVVLLIRATVVIALMLYLRFSSKAFTYRFPLTMIVAGGLGNILDYFIYGHVIDMFHLVFWGYSYPVFNVADASIFLGIVGMLVTSLMTQRKKDDVPQTQ